MAKTHLIEEHGRTACGKDADRLGTEVALEPNRFAVFLVAEGEEGACRQCLGVPRSVVAGLIHLARLKAEGRDAKVTVNDTGEIAVEPVDQ